jgi:hypothetical protein
MCLLHQFCFFYTDFLDVANNLPIHSQLIPFATMYNEKSELFEIIALALPSTIILARQGSACVGASKKDISPFPSGKSSSTEVCSSYC